MTVPADKPLGGKSLTAEAKEVLRERRVPLHYLQIQEALVQRGIQINGREPSATLLAALGRAEGVEAVGRRSGFYKLHEEPGDLLDSARWIISIYRHDKWMPAASGVRLAELVEAYFSGEAA